MEPADVANLLGGGALAVSIIVAVRSELTGRKAARDAGTADTAAKKSADAAERSASAAEKSLELEERSAAATERMADQWAEYMSRAEKRDQRQWSSRPSSGGGPGGYETRSSGPWAGLPPSGGPPKPVVHWTVDKVKGRLHMLRNLGRATAYGVTLRSDNAVRFDGPDSRDLKMGEAVEFLAIGSMQTGTPELVVTWRDSPDGELQEWRRPVP
jgi:hypothetical protein